MDRVIVLSLGDDTVRAIADIIEQHWCGQGKDPAKMAVVFGGKRPGLFLKRELAQRRRSPFIPPRIFSMDEFVECMVRHRNPGCSFVSDLDASYRIYRLCRMRNSRLSERRQGFARFLPWAREILRFIELLDLDAVEDTALHAVSLNAAIGYEVPQAVNDMLEEIVPLRAAFHEDLRASGAFTRGLAYLTAAHDKRTDDLPWEHALFCGLFAPHAAEVALVRNHLDTGRGTAVVQGDETHWPALRDLGTQLSYRITEPPRPRRRPRISLVSCADTHTQAGVVREILGQMGQEDLASTVVVVPKPETLMPILTAVGSTGEFNVSLGYPLSRSSLSSLIRAVFTAQRTRKEDRYYTPDYLAAIRHPIAKNLSFGDPETTRTAVHRIEDALTGTTPSSVAGSRFILLREVEEALKSECEGSAPADSSLLEAAHNLHRVLFSSWEKISSVGDLARALDELLRTILERGTLAKHPPNLAALETAAEICDELASAAFHSEPMASEDVFLLCEDLLDHAAVPFSGSPLGGLQILGLMETRSLSFARVIVTSANESVLPAVRITEPLIPRDVMVALGIRRLEQEEESQRYHLMRLLASAQTVHLCYEEDPQFERSRFIEEIVWNAEKEAGRRGVLTASARQYRVEVTAAAPVVEKSGKILDALREFVFSPSALDDYLSCPLKFCRRYLFRIREQPNLLEETEGSEIGSFLHRFLKALFDQWVNAQPRIGQRFRQQCLAHLRAEFKREFGERMRSDGFLTLRILETAVERFLTAERDRQVKKVVALEQQVCGIVPTPQGDAKCKATVDRIDLLPDDTLLVIDYKSGTADLLPRQEISRAVPEGRRRIAAMLKSTQIPLCIHLCRQLPGAQKVAGAYYFLRRTHLKEVFEWRGADPSRADDALRNSVFAIGHLIGEILDPSLPFAADPLSDDDCALCPFSLFCT